MREIEDILRKISVSADGRELNEATTRHRIIDTILHDILAWPKSKITCEDNNSAGRSDYVLKNELNEIILIIEAKKEGIYFNLPHIFKTKPQITTIKKISSDNNISEALTQARNYCLAQGSRFGAITNGHEWIVFISFEDGKKWENLTCYIIPHITDFSKHYTEIHSFMSYTAICRENSLSMHLSQRRHSILPKFSPSLAIKCLDFEIKKNRLASKLKPIVLRFFDNISPQERIFMEKCYVIPKQYSRNFSGFSDIILDRINPFFEEYNVKNFYADEDGGKFGKEVEHKVTKKYRGDVVVIFGGKGAGKSTFIKKFFYHSPPSFIRNNAIIIFIDLLPCPEEKKLISSTIWKDVVFQLDMDNLLSGDRTGLIALFNDKFIIAQNQTLKGLDPKSQVYNEKLNSAIQRWKNDKKYVSKKLSEHWKIKNKEIIVIIDNTDQFTEKFQDFCFTISQEISNEIGCTTIIPMREERFYSSKIRGLLDAYHNNGFHLTSPSTQDVFKKRVRYVLNTLIDHPNTLKLRESKTKDDLVKFFRILNKAFNETNSQLNRFMTASSHGNIRFALDIFRDYILSGYLNVDEMLSINNLWTIQNHQVIKPMMTPNRFYYNETISHIPNIFQLRHSENSSHFTALRILNKLYGVFTPRSPGFVSEPLLRKEFIDIFDMQNDYEQNMNVLLRYGIIEANNRFDYYCNEVDSVKLTTYGVYFFTELAKNFVYLDIVCSDCRVYSETLSNTISAACNDELELFIKKNPMERINMRIGKVESFIEYLIEEENREFLQYNLHSDYYKIANSICSSFSEQKDVILKSARKNAEKHNWN